jgi:hypothetical protein
MHQERKESPGTNYTAIKGMRERHKLFKGSAFLMRILLGIFQINIAFL